MLESILPASVVVEETRGDVDLSTLHPDEAAAVARAVPGRQLEFATGRACARAALGRLGQAPDPLLRGPSGEPQWPPGLVGSITHCRGYRAAAVARRRDVAALGIDAEPHLPMPHGLERFATGHDLPASDQANWDRVAFSAMEAAAKARWSMTGEWVDLARVRVAIATAGSFVAMLPGTGTAAPWQGVGRWLVGDGIILTVVVLEVPERPSERKVL